MKSICILNKIEIFDNTIFLKTNKGKFKTNIINGSITIPIKSNNDDYLGLMALKEEEEIIVYHKNNVIKKIIINDNYDFINSEESNDDVVLSD